MIGLILTVWNRFLKTLHGIIVVYAQGGCVSKSYLCEAILLHRNLTCLVSRLTAVTLVMNFSRTLTMGSLKKERRGKKENKLEVIPFPSSPELLIYRGKILRHKRGTIPRSYFYFFLNTGSLKTEISQYVVHLFRVAKA